MPLNPVPGFQHFTTHHCVTGSLRHIYAFHEHPISEEMLLGIGAGVGFSYFHFKGQPPFFGGRSVPKPSMEEIAGQRTGVVVQPHTTTSQRRAKETLLALLVAGEPVMLQVDMGFLPYFDFDGQEYHFGGHVVVACGYDTTTNEVLVADRDEPLHLVPLPELDKARSSTYKPFPPHNLWYTFDFSHKRLPNPAEVRQAIHTQASLMLQPPINNLGVKGIRKAALQIPYWHQSMSANDIRGSLFNAYIFISPVGGSGGGNFRFMFSRFLGEAAEITEDPSFSDSAGEFLDIARHWEALGEWFLQASKVPQLESILGECTAPLNELAQLEEKAWNNLNIYTSS
jgi:hypothetical protein